MTIDTLTGTGSDKPATEVRARKNGRKQSSAALASVEPADSRQDLQLKSARGIPTSAAISATTHTLAADASSSEPGSAAILVDQEASPPTATSHTATEVIIDPPRQSKKAKVLGMLEQPTGASIGELMAATGWQVHTVRAFLTGVRKAGKELIRTKDDAGVTRYRIAAEA